MNILVNLRKSSGNWILDATYSQVMRSIPLCQRPFPVTSWPVFPTPFCLRWWFPGRVFAFLNQRHYFCIDDAGCLITVIAIFRYFGFQKLKQLAFAVSQGSQFLLMPGLQTMLRAMSLAFSKSFWAPVEMLPKAISSAMSPPSKMAIWPFSSFSVDRNFSSSGNCKVKPVQRRPVE